MCSGVSDIPKISKNNKPENFSPKKIGIQELGKRFVIFFSRRLLKERHVISFFFGLSFILKEPNEGIPHG